MTKVLLSVHVLAAILVIGPIAVAASLFPRYALAVTERDEHGGHAAGVAALLHRISRSYAVVGVAVPAFGLALGGQLGVLGDAWLIASITLTALAAALLGLAILPGQQRMLAATPVTATREGLRSTAIRLTFATGAFNVLWATVVILMVFRPGSTTGV